MTDDATEARSDLMRPEEAASYLRVSASTLARWRTYGGGPVYLKLGRIFYRQADLDDFIAGAAKVKTRDDARRG